MSARMSCRPVGKASGSSKPAVERARSPWRSALQQGLGVAVSFLASGVASSVSHKRFPARRTNMLRPSEPFPSTDTTHPQRQQDWQHQAKSRIPGQRPRSNSSPCGSGYATTSFSRISARRLHNVDSECPAAVWLRTKSVDATLAVIARSAERRSTTDAPLGCETARRCYKRPP